MLPARLHTIGHKLRPSTHTTAVTVRPKEAAPFYLSAEWKALMRQIIKVRGRRCEDPDHEAFSPRSGVQVYGDHIVEISDGGARLDPTNVMLRCAVCHGRKTARSRAERLMGGAGQ